jgi:hypothetical protein
MPPYEIRDSVLRSNQNHWKTIDASFQREEGVSKLGMRFASMGEERAGG